MSISKKSWVTAASAAAALVLIAAGATWWGVAHSKKGEEKTAEVRTAVVERTSLAAGLELRGTLAYADAQDLAGATGIVTKVPEAGSTHKAGEPLLEIEGNPVFLLHGAIPLWRDLAPGVSGIDVDALRGALTELGYTAGDTAPATPYDGALAAAVDQLYADAGYPAPSTRPDAVQARDEANQELAAAKETLAAAQQGLREARRGPSSRELTDANNAVAAAERALAKALNCTDKERQEDPGPGGLCDEQAAREAVDSARAGLADLKQARDTSAEAASVEGASAAVAAAQTKADRAALSAVTSKDILLVPTKEMRVDQVKAKVGQSAEGPVVSWTSTTVYAFVSDLTDSQTKLITTGAEVEVKLVDGSLVEGVVADVTAARQDPNTYETIPARARIDIEDQAALKENGISGVTLTIIQDEAADTLVVPVTALLALSEGGYAVEKADGTLVGVDVGLVQDTRAQVIPTQGELEEGDEVVIA
ncbi:MAG: hypothetical protein LBL01_05680 [Bifidobacteriaceae bacterium]|nr:hypothetical protein [Bifidobacteriaceae bacterium]